MSTQFDICSKPALKRLFKAIGYQVDHIRTLHGDPHRDETVYAIHTDLKNTFSIDDISAALSTRGLMPCGFKQIDANTIHLGVTFSYEVSPVIDEKDWLS